jgi:predicted metal-binding protein
MVRNPVGSISEEQLQDDLAKYRRQAIELGAWDAKVIHTEMVVVDDRVRAKCTYPRCPSYGTNVNCPPYAMSLEEVRKVLRNFRYGILAGIKIPADKIAGHEASTKHLDIPYKKIINEVVSKIEAQAFYDGYYLALAFGSGNCKNLFCPDTDCKALIPGQSCVHHLKARAPMEAVGIDCFNIASRVGWDIYSIGSQTTPEDVPYGIRMGLVLIA